MPPVGFEPTIPSSERPQTYALDRAATGTGSLLQLHEVILTKYVLKITKDEQNVLSIAFCASLILLECSLFPNLDRVNLTY